MGVADDVYSTVPDRFREAELTYTRRLRFVLKGLSIAGFFVVWWALVRFGVAGFDLFVTPQETLTSTVAFLQGEPMTGGRSIYLHAAYSAGRVVIAFLLAVSIAIPLGLVIGLRNQWEELLFPALESLRSIPPVAWVPLAILMYANQLSAVVFVIFIGAFFPILVNTVEGVRGVDDEYVRSARSLGASNRQVLRHVVLPAALPAVVTGCALGLGLAWITVVAAEMIAGGLGLGYAIFQAYRMLQNDVVAVGMLAIGLLGYLSSAMVYWLGNYLTPWYEGELG